MPGIFTCFGGSVPRNAIRLTWAMTMPPARRAACAIEIISPKTASCSIVMLPSSSALVPRTSATSTRKDLKKHIFLAADGCQFDKIFGRPFAPSAAAEARIDKRVQADMRG